MAGNAAGSKNATPVASQKYSLKEPIKPVNRMTRKELEEAVVSLREKSGELHSAMAGLRYKLGKAQKRIKSYQLANRTRRLVQEASERTGRPPIDKKPWLGSSKEEEERSQNIMKKQASRGYRGVPGPAIIINKQASDVFPVGSAT